MKYYNCYVIYDLLVNKGYCLHRLPETFFLFVFNSLRSELGDTTFQIEQSEGEAIFYDDHMDTSAQRDTETMCLFLHITFMNKYAYRLRDQILRILIELSKN